MNNFQLIEELCGICEQQSRIILAQAAALEQVGAVVMEEERAAVKQKLARFIDAEECT